jgi:cell division protein FtsI (penicillin-binding protein 3)
MLRPGVRRTVWVAAVLAIGWIYVALRVFDLQAVQASELESQALDQRLRNVELAADRGPIVDRNGRELAVTVEASSIYANPREIPQPVEVAQQLGAVLGISQSELMEALTKDTGFVYLARKVEPSVADTVAALRLPGIYSLDELTRAYPAGPLAAQVIGIVGIDNAGLEGMELTYEEDLRGTPGQLVFERARDGKRIPQADFSRVEAETGTELVTSLDTEIQFFVERQIALTQAETGAHAVTAVVLDTETFEILAMASSPGFDPRALRDYPAENRRNRAVTDTYEPGSTQKLITVAAAIEEGVVSPSTEFVVDDRITVFDREYRDYKPHETWVLSTEDIVARSSNVGTIRIWEKLGNETLSEYLGSFGLGFPTGVVFPGEARGVVRPVTEWCDSCGASTSIGYRVAVTPLQMTSVFATIANDGVRLTPSLIHGATSTDPVQVVSESTASIMRSMLARVVDEGTGSSASVAGYEVGGKTGTTRIFDSEAGEYGEDVMASFIGIGPIKDARLAVGVFVESPQTPEDATGGDVAAPAFAEIMEFSLFRLGIGGSQ